jgi:hypothetical protein
MRQAPKPKNVDAVLIGLLIVVTGLLIWLGLIYALMELAAVAT